MSNLNAYEKVPDSEIRSHPTAQPILRGFFEFEYEPIGVIASGPAEYTTRFRIPIVRQRCAFAFVHKTRCLYFFAHYTWLDSVQDFGHVRRSRGVRGVVDDDVFSAWLNRFED